MLRKSIARAFDPFYMSPVPSPVCLRNMSDVLLTSDNSFLEDSVTAMPSDSTAVIRIIIEDIIAEAICKIDKLDIHYVHKNHDSESGLLIEEMKEIEQLSMMPKLEITSHKTIKKETDIITEKDDDMNQMFVQELSDDIVMSVQAGAESMKEMRQFFTPPKNTEMPQELCQNQNRMIVNKGVFLKDIGQLLTVLKPEEKSCNGGPAVLNKKEDLMFSISSQSKESFLTGKPNEEENILDGAKSPHTKELSQHEDKTILSGNEDPLKDMRCFLAFPLSEGLPQNGDTERLDKKDNSLEGMRQFLKSPCVDSLEETRCYLKSPQSEELRQYEDRTQFFNTPQLEELSQSEDTTSNEKDSLEDMRQFLKSQLKELPQIEDATSSNKEEDSLKYVRGKSPQTEELQQSVEAKFQDNNISRKIFLTPEAKPESDCIQQSLEPKCKECRALKTGFDMQQIEIEKLKSICEMKDKSVAVLRMEFEAKEKQFQEVMSGYTDFISKVTEKFKTLSEEHNLANKHLANMEVAFSDIHEKYERAKIVIGGYKMNEENLKSTLSVCRNALKKNQDQYEGLQLKSIEENQKLKEQVNLMKEDFAEKKGRQASKLRHLEIQVSSLTSALEQKSKECQDLTKLFEEVTNKFQG